MKKLITYPKRLAKGQDFSKEIVQTVPNQSMTMQEIILRFTRGEKLPVEHKGAYSTKFGDLEKLKNEDITEKEARIQSLGNMARQENDYLAKQKSDKKARIDAKRAREQQQKTDQPTDQPKT